MDLIAEPGRFYAEDQDGKLYAEVTYQTTPDDQAYILDHTFVSPDYRGQGLASQLVKAVVDQARSDGKKIIPLCSYAKVEFARKSEYADVYLPK